MSRIVVRLIYHLEGALRHRVALYLCKAFSRQLVWGSCPSGLPWTGNAPVAEGGHTNVQGSLISPQDEEDKGSYKSAGHCPAKDEGQLQHGQMCSWAHTGPTEQVRGFVPPGDISWRVGPTEPKGGLGRHDGEAGERCGQVGARGSAGGGVGVRRGSCFCPVSPRWGRLLRGFPKPVFWPGP